MKANLIIYFNYDNKPDDDKEKEIADLLMSFGEFCEDTDFEFQTIPRVGEFIKPETLLKKWIENDDYEKPCSDGKAFSKIYQAFRTGSFIVEEIYHALDSCTIHCSDIEYKEIE